MMILPKAVKHEAISQMKEAYLQITWKLAESVEAVGNKWENWYRFKVLVNYLGKLVTHYICKSVH